MNIKADLSSDFNLFRLLWEWESRRHQKTEVQLNFSTLPATAHILLLLVTSIKNDLGVLFCFGFFCLETSTQVPPPHQTGWRPDWNPSVASLLYENGLFGLFSSSPSPAISGTGPWKMRTGFVAAAIQFQSVQREKSYRRQQRSILSASYLVFLLLFCQVSWTIFSTGPLWHSLIGPGFTSINWPK